MFLERTQYRHVLATLVFKTNTFFQTTCSQTIISWWFPNETGYFLGDFFGTKHWLSWSGISIRNDGSGLSNIMYLCRRIWCNQSNCLISNYSYEVFLRIVMVKLYGYIFSQCQAHACRRRLFENGFQTFFTGKMLSFLLCSYHDYYHIPSAQVGNAR